MHELSVTESMLEIALRHAQEAHATKINTLHVTIGEMASIVDDSVQFYWDFVSRGTLAEGSQLVFERLLARMCCQECGMEYHPDHSQLACPNCESTHTRLIQGEEFFLAAIDIDT